MYSNYVEIRKCCSSRNALKMLGGPGQPDLGRCHSVGTLLGANNNNTLKQKIDNFNADKNIEEINILDED